MQLPTLYHGAEVSVEQLVRLFHHARQRACEMLGEAQTLDSGVAIVNPELSLVYDANHICDASLPQGALPAPTVEAVDAFFASCGSRCAYWVMNPGAPADRTEPLVAFLQSGGYQKHCTQIMYLRHVTYGPLPQAADLTIIPARASFRQARELAHAASAHHGAAVAAQLAEGAVRQLEDPHSDGLLALKSGRAVAMASVLTVGDVGLIEDVYVAADMRRQGIGRIMMARMLDICIRSAHRHVMLGVDAGNTPAESLYQSLGFERVGEIACWRRGS